MIAGPQALADRAHQHCYAEAVRDRVVNFSYRVGFGFGLGLGLLACKPPPANPTDPVTRTPPPSIAIAESEPDPPPATPSVAANPLRLPDETLRQLYACWFESPYEYMFASPVASERALPISGVHAGQFMAGVGGIMSYGSLSSCAEKLSGVEKRSYSSIEPIEALAGMSVREDVHRDGYKPGRFNRYHAEIVRWGAAALVPDPNLVIVDDWSAGELYQAGFSRFFRLMTHTYFDLEQRDALEVDRDQYLAATLNGQDGIDWLHAHYGGRLSQYGGYHDGTQMTAGMAYGFWLRRSDDGTAPALWAALSDFMQVYDPAWFAGLDAAQRKG